MFKFLKPLIYLVIAALMLAAGANLSDILPTKGQAKTKSQATTASVASKSTVPKELQGKVVKVYDGDTITVLDSSNVQNKIRLNGIDAPEAKMPFGNKSQKLLASMVAGKMVKVTIINKDRYGRFVGDIAVEGNPDVNATMVAKGMAWHYKQYSKSAKLAQLETQARQQKLGLWADPNPTPPWEYRKMKKTKSK